MLNIGCHLSISKGFAHMGKEALSIGANTFQFFTRNPRGAKAKDIKPDDVAALLAIIKEHNFAPLIAHAPYTLNLCSAKEDLLNFSRETVLDDLRRLELLPGNYYNLHPGSHGGMGAQKGVELIAESLNHIMWKNQQTTMLLETMAGSGNEVGGTFEELKAIIDATKWQDKMGVCLDTCHVFAAGYDIVNKLDKVLNQFDKIIGLKHLKAIHLNDSLTPYASHKDRHAKIGQGTIGLEAIKAIINSPGLRTLPFCLETPNELPGYAQEIKLLQSLYKN